MVGRGGEEEREVSLCDPELLPSTLCILGDFPARFLVTKQQHFATFSYSGAVGGHAVGQGLVHDYCVLIN